MTDYKPIILNNDGQLERLQATDKFKLNNGAGVNEISTDGTLGANSDDILSTQKAVKTYVDSVSAELLEQVQAISESDTLQSVTSRGATTDQTLTLTNAGTGLIIEGDLVVKGTEYIQNTITITEIVSGDEIVGGGLTVHGDVTLGDDASDDININGTVQTNIVLNNTTITGLATPLDGLDATNKDYVDQGDAASLAYTDAASANLVQMIADKASNLSEVLANGNDANGQLIKNLGGPVDGTDAATKDYVDQGDAASLAYTESVSAELKSYIDTQDQNVLVQSMTYTDTVSADLLAQIQSIAESDTLQSVTDRGTTTTNTITVGGLTSNGVIDAGNNYITNVATPTLGTDAVNRDYVDDAFVTNLPNNLSFNNTPRVNLVLNGNAKYDLSEWYDNGSSGTPDFTRVADANYFSGYKINAYGDYSNRPHYKSNDFTPIVSRTVLVRYKGNVVINPTAGYATAKIIGNVTGDVYTFNLDGSYYEEVITLPAADSLFYVDINVGSNDSGNGTLEIGNLVIQEIVSKDFSTLLSENNDAGGNIITNLGGPVDGTDATTKDYVDTLVMAATGMITEADDLQTVTDRGNTTTNAITIDNVVTVGDGLQETRKIEAGEDLSAGDVVYLDGNTVKIAGYDIAASRDLVIGITTNGAASGEMANVLVHGTISNTGWSLTSPGSVFVGATGAIQQTMPASGYSQKIGIVKDATTMLLAIKEAIGL